MNELFFACRHCKTYIVCGGRWAYWELEHTDIVSRDNTVDAQAVLNAEKFWNPPKNEDSRWLYEGVFPPLRSFLKDHARHEIVFGEQEDFAPINSNNYFDWMQVGYLLDPTPRYLVEILGFTSWEQVRKYMEEQKLTPAWWELTWDNHPSLHERARRRFEELVSQK